MIRTNRFLLALLIVATLAAARVDAGPVKPPTPSRPPDTKINKKALATVEQIAPKIEYVSTVTSKTSDYKQITIRLANPKAFPIGVVPGPNLPPNPCKLTDKNRVFIQVVDAQSGEKKICTAVTADARMVLSFQEPAGHHLYVFAVVTDVLTGKRWMSQTIPTE